MNPICFYHKADLDGVCSGAIVKRFVPDCEMYGIDYGEELPIIRLTPEPAFCPDIVAWRELQWTEVELGQLNGLYGKRTVYMVDFSLPPEEMKRLAERSNLIWIDHHSLAIAEAIADGYATSKGGCAGVQTPAYAACELCWKWFSVVYERDPDLSVENYGAKLMGAEIPEAVRLLGRYDVWDKGDLEEWESKILPFQYGMRGIEDIYNPECDSWSDLFEADWESDYVEIPWMQSITAHGDVVLHYQAEANHRACESGARLEFIEDPRSWMPGGSAGFFTHGNTQVFGVRALACNTIVFNSQFFDGVYDPEKHDVMCAYCQLANGKWKVSLYTTHDTIDCGEIAKVFGGGGHKKAAGFICESLPWGERLI